MERTEHLHGKLQVSGILIILGLLIEAVCLLWSRPIAFVILASVGGLLIGVGVLFFLYSLVSVTHQDQSSKILTGDDR